MNKQMKRDQLTDRDQHLDDAIRTDELEKKLFSSSSNFFFRACAIKLFSLCNFIPQSSKLACL
jgi:hypothetical protein